MLQKKSPCKDCIDCNLSFGRKLRLDRQFYFLSMKNISLFILIIVSPLFAMAQTYEQRIQAMVDSFYLAHPSAVGIIIHLESGSKKLSYSYAAGYSNKQLKTPLYPNQPVLTASNTKTYVSAAILKLMEQHQLDINQSIGSVLDPKTNKKLMNAGYLTDSITIKQLLSHTSGIADFINDDYFDFVNKNKRYRWNRDEQITLATRIGKPLAMPGDTFKYADINYLLASEIIENKTKLPFYEGISKLLSLKLHGLHSTWFMSLQKKPKQSAELAHQYYDKLGWDSYDLDPSWDLYGGGGIATSAKDLASFFQLLFEGNIIHDPKLISSMYTPVSHQSNYALGIRKISLNGYTGYYHGGWWGTDATYVPELETSIVVFILERGSKGISSEICKKAIQIITNK